MPCSAFETAISDPDIRLRAQGITNTGTRAIAETLEAVDTCDALCLEDNLIGPEGAEALTELLSENLYIRTIDLSGNDIRHKGLDAFGRSIQVLWFSRGRGGKRKQK